MISRASGFVLCWCRRLWLVALAGAWLSADAAVRVALLDFSTDDNSYRSIQAAAQFTDRVQIGLADEPATEWVERSQIRLVKTEFSLAEMKATGGLSPIRRGRMLGANWLVTGHFSSDDRERPTLTFQVIELGHADALANATVVLPAGDGGETRFGNKQVEFAVASLRRLLADARANESQATHQTRLALLFFAETSRFSFGRGSAILGREFSAALERLTSTNQQIRLVKFPKAHQATEESEMAVDGIIQAEEETWRPTADLFVWGTYAETNVFAPGHREARLDVQLNLWDGAGPPAVVKETVPLDPEGKLPAPQASDLIGRLAARVLAAARRSATRPDSTAVRQEIAASIVKAYVGMTGRGKPSLGLHDKEKFVEAVHMLETACFFDPNNKEARLLWVTCRYGWWLDFRFNVKNQFWTTWRRSEAWKNYVERFGLAPGNVALPFPYHGQDAIGSYFVRSLGDVVQMFPQWHSAEEIALEDEWRKQGTHTWLVEAEAHGFPKEMPHDLAFAWRKELEVELEQRKRRVSEFQAAEGNASPGAPMAKNSPGFGPAPQQPAFSAKPGPPVERRVADVSARGPQIVPRPSWLRDMMPLFGMFKLYPPNVLPVEARSEVQVIRFPPRYEVKVVNQLEYREGRLWILAMDERSAPTSAATPDLAGERLDKSSRLWTLASEGLDPALFKTDGLPSGINRLLFHQDQLWLAGDSVSLLNLSDETVRRFGLAEGFTLREVETITVAGGRIFAAGDTFDLSAYDPASGQWSRWQPPMGKRSHGTGNPYVLAGSAQWLGYVAGSAYWHDFNRGTWTNLAQMNEAKGFLTDGDHFWVAGARGLQRFHPGRQALQSWPAPVFLESPMLGLVGNPAYMSNPQVEARQLENAEQQILGCLKKLDGVRREAHLARTNRSEPFDPFHLTARIPGEVAVLVNDGEFLWLGANNYFGSYLLLLHKPSLSLVAGHTMGVRETISSVAISDQYVWVGTAYGDNSLLRLRKKAFSSVPRSQWVRLELAAEERQRILRGMSRADQALYAFYAGDDQRAAELLGDPDPAKASLSEMFLLAWTHDASGADNPARCRDWYERIIARYPDSPWAQYAMAAAKTNEVAHEARRVRELALTKFDRNHNGKLEEAEQRAAHRDPAFAQEEKKLADQQTQADMEQIVKRYDQDQDGLLNQAELKRLCQTLAVFSQARRENPNLPERRQVFDSLLSEHPLSAEEMLKRGDTNRDQKLSAAELSALAARRKK